jgi:hypothetical protein
MRKKLYFGRICFAFFQYFPTIKYYLIRNLESDNQLKRRNFLEFFFMVFSMKLRPPRVYFFPLKISKLFRAYTCSTKEDISQLQVLKTKAYVSKK